MSEPLKWEKITIATHIESNTTSFHVNMKEFMGLYTTDELMRFDGDDDSGYFEKFNKLYDIMSEDDGIDEKYLIGADKLLPFVLSMREIRRLHEVISNGIGDMISNFAPDYLRFYKYNDKFVVTNDCVPMVWNNFVMHFTAQKQ